MTKDVLNPEPQSVVPRLDDVEIVNGIGQALKSRTKAGWSRVVLLWFGIASLLSIAVMAFQKIQQSLLAIADHLTGGGPVAWVTLALLAGAIGYELGRANRR